MPLAKEQALQCFDDLQIISTVYTKLRKGPGGLVGQGVYKEKVQKQKEPAFEQAYSQHIKIYRQKLEAIL